MYKHNATICEILTICGKIYITALIKLSNTGQLHRSLTSAYVQYTTQILVGQNLKYILSEISHDLPDLRDQQFDTCFTFPSFVYALKGYLSLNMNTLLVIKEKLVGTLTI